MNKKAQFIQLLKEYGVTKCHGCMGFDPRDTYARGMVFVNVNNKELLQKIFKRYSRENDLDTPEGEELGVAYSDFTSGLETNIEI